jgi:hypothetical protein
MLPSEINTGGVRAATPCVGEAVRLTMDSAYPAGLPRSFHAVLVAVYPRGLLMVRTHRGAREYVSFIDVFAGHVQVSGVLGQRLRRAWLMAEPQGIGLAASW